MESTHKNIKIIALSFLLTIGLVQIITTFMVFDGNTNSTVQTINKILDVPFILAALLFLWANIFTSENKKKSQIITSVIFAILAIGIIIISIMTPDIK